MASSRAEFLSGVRAEIPLLVGVVPFGMIYGVLALGAGLSHLEAQSMSAIIFAGSSQFVSAQLFGVGAPGLVIFITAVVINLRHALYSASIAPYLKSLEPVWKFLLAYLLTDEAYAVSIIYYRQRDDFSEGDLPDKRCWFFLGAGLALWTTWQLSTAVGVLLGTQVPASWSLDFTLALTFIAIITPGLRDRPTLAAALSAGVAAVFTYTLPFRLGLLLASLVGIGVGLWMERWRGWK